MAQSQLMLVTFVGGPFDGFCQNLSALVDDFPVRVALPISRSTGKLFGLRCETSNRIAVYKRVLIHNCVQYHFREIRRCE